jgi:hypothetical protein
MTSPLEFVALIIGVSIDVKKPLILYSDGHNDWKTLNSSPLI